MMKTVGRRLLGLGLALSVVAVAAPVGAEWNKGVEAFRAKNYAVAITEFEEVTRTNPDYAGAYYMLGLAQSNSGKLSQALANLRKAVELDSGNSSYLIGLGQALLQAKQYNDAFTTFSKFQLSTLDAQHRTRYALLYAQAATKSNRPQEAVNVLRAQSRADSRNSDLYRALGLAYEALGDEPNEYSAFKRAFELDAKDLASGRKATRTAITLARRSRSAQDKKDYYTQAASIAEKLARSSSTFDHNLLAGEAWLGAKEYAKAVTWFDKARAQKPQNALVYFYRGQCYTSLDRYNDALTDLQQALKIGASGKLRTQVHNQMGYVYDKQKNYDKAAASYREAGNQRMVTQVLDKKEKAEQNAAADAEMAEFRRKLAALEHQITELEKLGEVQQADELRQQLDELKKALPN